ncbi:MAG TPA: POTRA domain-containing protein [Bryobacteraceae bacterium]
MRAFLTLTLLFTNSIFAEDAATSGAPSIESVTLRGTQLKVDFATQVGHPYDAAAIQQDLHRLWNTGRFDDIRVEREETSIVFHVVENPRLRLRKLVIEPSTTGLQLALAEGAPIDEAHAHAVVVEARKQLIARGYVDPHVDYNLFPIAGSTVDLRLTVNPGERVRVREIQFSGGPGLAPRELSGALSALHIRRTFHWRLLPAYSQEAIDADLARLRSLYMSNGYYDASVRLDGTELQPDGAHIRIFVQPGPRYHVRVPAAASVCTGLLSARREAQRQGILDFTATLHVLPADANHTVDLIATTERGRPYRVGRIDFIGNHRHSDATLRRNFLLDEGQLLDELQLRKSLGRLNRGNLFEPVTEKNVAVQTNEASGIADITVRLIERKRGAWNLSGPVGPASFAGPLQASISSRLPPWGAGLFELSTYTASVSMFAFAHPILPLLAIGNKHPLLPVLALARPFSPAYGWKSGFSIAPQLGWRASALSYAIVQTQQRLLPALSGDRGLVSQLPVTVQREKSESVMFCEQPKPRFTHARDIASLAIRFVGSFASF